MSRRHPVLLLSVAALTAAIGTTAWALNHLPTSHARIETFLSVAALLLLHDMLLYERAGGGESRWPTAGLTAAIVLFLHDPLVVLFAVLVAAPLAGLIRADSVKGQVTKTAWWVLASTSGLVVYAASANAGLIVGCAVLILFYTACESLKWVSDQTGSTPGRLTRLRTEIFTALLFSGLGAVYAFLWLSPKSGSGARHVGQIAVILSAGLIIGCVLGGSIANLWRWTERISSRRGFLIGLFGLTTFVIPGVLARGAVTVAAAALLIVFLKIRTLGGVLVCVGAITNLAVVQLNGGSMPVDPNALFRLIGPAAYVRYAPQTYLESAGTVLSVLEDRIVLPHPFPFAAIYSAGDIILAIGLVLLVIERMLAHPAASGDTIVRHRSAAA